METFLVRLILYHYALNSGENRNEFVGQIQNKSGESIRQNQNKYEK